MTTFLFILGLAVAAAALALWSLPVAGVFLGGVLMAAAVGLELGAGRRGGGS